MLFKIFRKSPASQPRFEQDAMLTAAWEQRVNAIEFQPSKGFLKDRQQPKRSAETERHDSRLRRQAS